MVNRIFKNTYVQKLDGPCVYYTLANIFEDSEYIEKYTGDQKGISFYQTKSLVGEVSHNQVVLNTILSLPVDTPAKKGTLKQVLYTDSYNGDFNVFMLGINIPNYSKPGEFFHHCVALINEGEKFYILDPVKEYSRGPYTVKTLAENYNIGQVESFTDPEQRRLMFPLYKLLNFE